MDVNPTTSGGEQSSNLAPLPFTLKDLQRVQSEEARSEAAVKPHTLFGKIRLNFTPFVLSRERLEVEKLLLQRTCFPEVHWLESGLRMDFITNILQAIALIQGWPNGNFIPPDPLASVLLPGENELALPEIHNAVSRNASLDLTLQMFQMFVEKDMSLGEFLVAIYRTGWEPAIRNDTGR